MKPTEIYQMLLKHFGEQKWWPIDIAYHEENNSDSRFEIIIGTILTQNTAWSNVEKALINLKKNRSLGLKKILKADDKKLKKMIKPSGFFNQKTERLKNISNFLETEYNCDLDLFFDSKTKEIRGELLNLKGIGPETADSILLYAGGKPVFVVDAYTKRVCKRLHLDTNCSYDEIQNYFEKNLKKNFSNYELVNVYKEFHALIVELAKNFCKTKAECKNCPICNKCEKKI